MPLDPEKDLSETQAYWRGRVDSRLDTVEQRFTKLDNQLSDIARDFKDYRHALNNTLNTMTLTQNEKHQQILDKHQEIMVELAKKDGMFRGGKLVLFAYSAAVSAVVGYIVHVMVAK